MKKILFISFLLSNVCWSLTNNSTCDLQENNDKFKSNLIAAKDEVEQIEIIKSKINFDKKYIELKPTIKTDHYLINNGIVDENGNQCGSKILFIVSYGKNRGKVVNISQQPSWTKVLEKVNEKNVEKIEYVFNKKAEEIYGSYGKVGVIQIYIKDKELKNLIKRTVM